MPETVQTKYHMTSVNELIESVNLPSDFAVALMSGRPELVKMIHRPNGLSEDETTEVAHAFGVILETHQALQDHVKQLAEVIEHLYGQVKGTMVKVDHARDLVNFREPIDTTDEY